jgi:hypothetical protein
LLQTRDGKTRLLAWYSTERHDGDKREVLPITEASKWNFDNFK